jgi:hypothetical protein
VGTTSIDITMTVTIEYGVLQREPEREHQHDQHTRQVDEPNVFGVALGQIIWHAAVQDDLGPAPSHRVFSAWVSGPEVGSCGCRAATR